MVMHALCTLYMYSGASQIRIETYVRVCARTGIRRNYCVNVLATGVYSTKRVLYNK